MDSSMEGLVAQNAYQPSANSTNKNCDTFDIKHVEQICRYGQNQDTGDDEQMIAGTPVFQYQGEAMLPLESVKAGEQLIDCSNSLNDDHRDQEDHHHLIQSTYQTGQTDEGIEGVSQNEQVSDLEADEIENIEMNDEDAFVALCTDTSSVLNNDPTRRYYINKLYQPMNAQQNETPLAEQDDEYLLYEELRFHAAQELSDERQRVQLTKILEDDDGDDCDLDDDHVNDDTNLQRDDTLERLHLTTIIEAFGSFPSSPLIDSCNGRDSLMIEACQGADECQDDKPDSTRHHSEESPTSSVGNGNNLSSTTSYLQPTNHQQEHRIEHDGFDDCNQADLQLGLGHKNLQNIDNIHDQDPHFSPLTSDNHSAYRHHESQHQNEINDQHQQHHHQQQPLRQHQQPYSHQKGSDISSEISYFQQVSSTFLPSISTKQNLLPDDSSSNRMRILEDYELKQQQQQQKQTSAREVKAPESRQTRKRFLQQVNEYDDRTLNEEFTKSKPIRAKKKRTSKDTVRNSVKTFRKSNDTSIAAVINRDEGGDSPNGNVTSSISTPNERTSAIAMDTDSNNIYKTNQYPLEQITKNEDSNCSGRGEGDEFDDEEDEFSINQDEPANSSGRRNPHMSKYRRRTANARERIRMREINQAFEKLKKVVPVELIQQSASGDESDQTSVSSRRGWGKSSSNSSGQQSSSDSQSVKLTKITTLRLAVSYIAKLSEVLSQHPEGHDRVVNEDAGDPLCRIATGTTEIGANDAGNQSKSSISTNKVVDKKADKLKSRSGLKRRPRPAVKSAKSGAPPSAGKSLSETLKIKQISAVDGPETKKEKQMERPTIVLNQPASQSSQQQQTFLLTNNVLNGRLNHQASQNTSTFIQPMQQQLHKPRQQQIIYAQQPLAIPQSASSQDRTFVTPVAVAILGIPTGTNSNPGEVQQLQLLGIQNPHQIQQPVLRQQQFQTANGQHYNLITQQPQQVTLTLDDINGLSVLRLSNHHRSNSANNSPTTIQLQPGQQPTFMQQPQILATTSATTSSTGTFNYTSYQPLQVSQMQSIGGQIRPIITTRPTGNFQFQNDTPVSLTGGVHAMVAANRQLNSSTPICRNDVVAIGSNSLQQSITTTGNNSDRIDYGAAPSAGLAQATQNQVSGNFANGRATGNIDSQLAPVQDQIKIHQQPNGSSGQAVFQPNVGHHQLLTLSQNGTQIQFQAQPAGCLRGQTVQPANLIYINPPSANYTNENTTSRGNNNFHNQQQPQQQQDQANQMSGSSNNQISLASRNRTQGSSPAFEQMKFVTQFSSQPACAGQSKNGEFPSNSEDNIRQLVASIATSIQPNKEVASKNGSGKQQIAGEEADKRQQQHAQHQQHHSKRTYRFHNYDGNMITNHLYSNHNDKHSQQQSSKRFGGQNQHHLEQTASSSSTNATPTPNAASSISISSAGQRSRQNSLSSTCSTISSASSSLNSSSLSSNVSPCLGFSPALMLKSTALDSGSNSSSDSTSAQSVPIVIVEEVEEAGGSC